jgi:aminoglycoside phosphotransferase (APT) family kinase protein
MTDTLINACLNSPQLGVLHLLRPLPSPRQRPVYLATTDDGRTVVTKGGTDRRTIAIEAHALACLAPAGAPCPRLLDTIDDHHTLTLVMEHVLGHRPATAVDFAALGVALAQLHQLPSCLLGLPTPLMDLLAPTLPVTQNHQQLRDVVLQLCENHAESPTSCAHGDASPDNTIVTTSGATLIDLETTRTSHPALDLGRTVFITALETGHTNVKAVIDGYRRHLPVPSDLADWTTAAGLQITTWRRAHPSAARCWKEALNATLAWAQWTTS